MICHVARALDGDTGSGEGTELIESYNRYETRNESS